MYTRFLDEKDFKDFYTLAYKALIERNDMGTDFDKPHFNAIIKNILVHPQHIKIGLYDNDIMSGFAILLIERMPYNNDLVGIFDLIHTDTAHRNVEDVQMLFDACYEKIKNTGVKKLVLNERNCALDGEKKRILLAKNHFVVPTINWERNL